MSAQPTVSTTKVWHHGNWTVQIVIKEKGVYRLFLNEQETNVVLRLNVDETIEFRRVLQNEKLHIGRN